jgi:hypothetical protein
MVRLLAIEWLKIRRYRTFWILAGLFIILFPLWNYGITNSIIQMGNGKSSGISFLSQAYSFPDVWENLGFWGSIFVLFLSVLVIILTTNEFTFRTHRQNVIDGWKRLDFYHAKVGQVILFSFLATLFLVIVGLIFGFVSGGADGVAYGWEKVLWFFLLCLDYMGFALLLALMIRRSGLAIGLFFLYSFILENLIKGMLNWKLPQPVGNFLPLQSSDELLPFSLMRTLGSMVSHGPEISDWTYAAVTAGWCLVYYLIGRRLLLARDW